MPTAAFLYTSCRCCTPLVASLLPKLEVALTQLPKGQNGFHSPVHPPRLWIAPVWPSAPPLLSPCCYHYLCYWSYRRTYFHAAAALLSGGRGILLLLAILQGFFWPARCVGEYKKQHNDLHAAHGSAQISPAAQEQGRELERRNAVPSLREGSQFAQWGPRQRCRGWPPLLVSCHPFSGMQKVSRKGLLWYHARKFDIWFLLTAVIKWLLNYVTVTGYSFGTHVCLEIEVNQIRAVWNSRSWQLAAKQIVGWICILFSMSKKVLSCGLEKSSQEQKACLENSGIRN